MSREIESPLDQLTGTIELGKTLFERRKRSRASITGILCGMSSLDKTIRGFTKRKLYTVGGRPGAGKTSFATSVTAGVMQMNNSTPVLYISTELSRVEILEQVVEAYAGVPFYPNSGVHSPEEVAKINSAISLVNLQLSLGLLGVVHYKRLSMEYINQIIDIHCELNEASSLVIIDQASRVQREESNGYTIGTEKMLNEMEELADTKDVPLILLSQLNRGANGIKPTMADYKWSGAFEEFSHAALLLWKEQKTAGLYHPWDSKIIIDKNRHGPTMDIEAAFLGECHLWQESDTYFHGGS